MDQRIGLFGGSFDPIHFGHLISARDMAERLQLSKVILIPCGLPPHKQNLKITPGAHRVAMARLATEGDPLFEVSEIELRRSGPSYTFDTVEELRRQQGTSIEFLWIIGADSLPELPTWHRIQELVQIVTLVTAARPGFSNPSWGHLERALGHEAVVRLKKHFLETLEIGISATELRKRIESGRSIRYFTPDNVESYIRQHGLYKS